MYSIDAVRVVEIESTNICNASCPQCMRTNETSPNDNRYHDVLDWSVASGNIPKDFWSHLDRINFNGTTGDNAAHPDLHKIVADVCSWAPRSHITLSTNGSLRDRDWWRDLQSVTKNHENFSVVFGIDGLSDTHHLYRVGTQWQRIIDNAQAFISAGGHAQWQMILFQHNQHQIKDCQDLSKSLGFQRFFVRKENRFAGDNDSQPVYWRGAKTHDIAKSTISDDMIYDQMFNDWSQDISKKIKISTKRLKPRCVNTGWLAIYADATVWPCCWTMGWHKSRHLDHHSLINYHFKKVLGIDFLKNNLYNHNLGDILDSEIWVKNFPNSFQNNPNPVCLQQCSN